jgi:hypothetical protein
LDRAVLKALAQRPEDRYQTASSLATALQEALSARDEPDVAASLTSEQAADASPAVTPSDEAPTLPAIPVVPTDLAARVQGAIAAAPRSPRVLMTTLVTLLLIAALGGAALASAFGLAHGAQTIFMPGPVVTATPQPGVNATPTPFGTPTTLATSTSVPPALTYRPSPLVLFQQDKHTCDATQIITNQTGMTVGWSWDPPAVDGFTFEVNRGQQVPWPSNRVPGIAPGGSDTLYVKNDCRSQTITIHMTDTLGHRYAFTLIIR